MIASFKSEQTSSASELSDNLRRAAVTTPGGPGQVSLNAAATTQPVPLLDQLVQPHEIGRLDGVLVQVQDVGTILRQRRLLADFVERARLKPRHQSVLGVILDAG